MSIINGFRLALVAGVACAAMVPAAGAQQAADAGGLEEIIVVGQRQAYRGDVSLKETPQSIQVIDNEVLKDLGITRLDAALELATGVSKQNNFGGVWDSFAVRGFAGDENFPSGFLVNGFNGGRGYGGPRDASNVERIEVLKGPNSALFGRGEPGGTVNIVTKKPSFNTEGSVTATVGSYDTYRIEGDVTGAITDKVAFRVNGAYEDTGSFRDTIDTKKKVASPSILAVLTEDTTLSYEMEYVDLEVPFDRGIVAVNGDLSVLPRSTFLGEPGDGPMDIEVLGHQAQLQHDINDEWNVLFGAAFKETSFKGYSSDAELASGRQTLYSTGEYLSRQRRYRDYDTEHTVLRSELAGRFNTGSLTHHLIVGADWDKFKIDQLQKRFRPSAYTAGGTITANNNAIDIFDPVYGSTPTPNSTLTNQVETQDAWGIYIQDQIDLTENFKIRFGGRYDDFKQDIYNRLNYKSIQQSYTEFSPQGGIVYNVTEEVSFYASYGRGFRPNSGTDYLGNPFGPEKSKSYEVGAKYESEDGNLNSTVSLFTMKKSNILTADPVNAGYSMAVGKARSKGIEFEANAKLPADMRLMVNYAYTDAEVAEDFLDPNFSQQILEGDPLINIPKHNANAMLFKDFDVGSEGKGSVGAGVNYVSRRLGETGVAFYLPSYTLVKLVGTYEPTDDIKLSVDVNNLFDKRYYASSYSRLWVAPGTPRTIMGHVTYSF